MEKGGSLLESYRKAFGSPRGKNVLDRFGDTLADLAPNSKRAYKMDVGVFLRDKLFYFWDFPINYNQVAEHLAIMHTLDLAGQRVNSGELRAQDAQSLLEKAISTSRDLVPMPKWKHLLDLSPKRQQEVYQGIVDQTQLAITGLDPKKLLGDAFECSYESDGKDGGRFRMQLREPRRPAAENRGSVIRKEDELMLNFLFLHPTVYCPGFWNEVMKDDKRGEVLTYEQDKGLSPNSLARRIIVLRRFREFLFENQWLSPEIMFTRMRAPKYEPKLQVTLDSRERKKVLRYQDWAYENSDEGEKPLNSRNRAMIYLIAGTGIRADAACKLKVQDVDLEKAEVLVVEKGRSERRVPIPEKALVPLRAYIESDRQEFVDRYGCKGDNVFFTVRGRPMNRRSLSRVIDERVTEAGVKKQVLGKTRVGSHAMRRTLAASLSEQGEGIEHIQEALGHKHVATTQRYVQSLGVNTKRVRKTLEKALD